MNLYLDASALVKEYLSGELGAEDVAKIRRAADVVGTSVISRVETTAALAKSARTKALARIEAREARESFQGDWPSLVQVLVTEALVARAERLAWEEDLRGYDAMQLASALVWKESLGAEVTFVTFDQQLWRAAGQHLLIPFPEDLPGMPAAWRHT